MELASICSAFGLSASAGLNAYIPLLIIAVGARLGYIQLAKPYDLLASNFAIIVLAVLLAVEIMADKVPAIDHANDVIMTFIRPTAGAILFAAYMVTPTITYIDPKVALVIGFLVAGATHGAKATARPVVTATTGGLGNPVVSTMEDIAALITSLVAVLAPLLIGLAMLFFAALFVWWYFRRRSATAVAGSG
jgi:uncharacterized membrane protein